MRFTPRECEVVDGIRRGLTYVQIGAELGISDGVVKNYVAQVAAKLPNPHRLPAKALVAVNAGTVLTTHAEGTTVNP